MDSLDKTSYRHAIAVVPQSPVLFSGTLWDNLVYGLKYVSAEQVLDVLKSVGLESLVTKHPDGLWRPIYEGGENLSGGQRQRIAIARALLR
ncbi:MAG: ABC transporter ATP-binding protein, partial [Oscillospiraceae bacterium]|nr:ABC transporter ATP-binding protein [Oscillospiraceae bacterium]